MERQGYDGAYILRMEAGGAPVETNAMLLYRTGESAILVGGSAPHKPGASGFVTVKEDGNEREYYASVFGLVWAKSVTSSETLAQFIKRNEHQALSIIKESAAAMGYNQAQWQAAMRDYWTS